MKRHHWIGVTMILLAVALGGVVWLRQAADTPRHMAEPMISVDPEKDAVMERLEQEHAEAQAGDAADLAREPVLENPQ